MSASLANQTVARGGRGAGSQAAASLNPSSPARRRRSTTPTAVGVHDGRDMGVVEIVDVRSHGVQRRRIEPVEARVAKGGLARPNGPAATGDQACGASSTPYSLLPSTL